MLVNSNKKWDYTLGMLKIDGIEPSPEFKRLIQREKRGELSMKELKAALDRKYKSEKIIIDLI